MHPLNKAQAEEAAARELSKMLSGCLGWLALGTVVLIIALAVTAVVR